MKTVKPATLNLNCKSFVANFEANFDGILTSFFPWFTCTRHFFLLICSLFDNTSLNNKQHMSGDDSSWDFLQVDVHDQPLG